MVLLLIFLLAVTLRFFYFPDNIYFGFDQARDGYAALNILRGDLKLIGPTTSFEGLHHGVLYYYLLSPFFFISQGNIEIVSVALRIINSLGVFLIHYLGTVIFSKRIGLLSALLYAISFEQTQFSLYMGNPAPAVLTVMLMYLGLAMVVFTGRQSGLPLALLGLGLSIQFQFALLYLFVPLLIIILIYHKSFIKLPPKIYLFSFFTLLFSLSSFIISEIKYGFKIFNYLFRLSESAPDRSLDSISSTFIYIASKISQYNLSGQTIATSIILVVLVVIFLFFITKKDLTKKLIYLGVWFLGILAMLIVGGGVNDLSVNSPLFYPYVGVSVSLLVFMAFLLDRVYLYSKIIAIAIGILIMLANLTMINKYNPNGPTTDFYVQEGMLLTHEKQVIDYLYQGAGREPFAVKAITMPFNINTTWSYLFEWYGQKTYGYLPVWNGKNALGYPGNLKVKEAQENLPLKRYLIIEPTRGIQGYLIDGYLKEEGYFTKVLDEKSFGQFIVQERFKY